MPEDSGSMNDISRPGRVQATPTSRPIIVGHRPTMLDPMVTRRPVEPEPTKPQLSAPAGTPPSASAGPVPIDGISAPSQTRQASSRTASITAKPFGTTTARPTAAKPPAYTTDLTQTTKPEMAVVDESRRPVPPAIIENRTKWWAPIVVLIIVLASLYLAVDSGLIHTSINLPFHVFKQESPPVYTPQSQ